jgi:hypothetical protein
VAASDEIMGSTVKKLSETFQEYEVLGAHQAIAMVTELQGTLNVVELQQRVQSLTKRWKALPFPPQLCLHSSRQVTVDTLISRGIADLTHPLEFHCISHPSGERFTFVIMLHHSFTDGLGTIEFYRALAVPKEIPEPPCELIDEFDRDEREKFSLISALQAAWRYLFIPKQNPGQPLSSQRAICSFSTEIQEIKRIKNSLNLTFNQIYLICIHEVLKKVYPDLKQATVLVPVNLRPRALRYAFGNYLLVAPIILKLKNSNRKSAAQDIKANSEELNSEKHIICIRSARRLIINLPSWLRKIGLILIAKRSLCIATYVPDMLSGTSFCGAAVISRYGIPALLPGQELGFCLMTSKDSFCISTVTAGRFIGRGEELLAIFQEALHTLASDNAETL